MKDDTEWNNHRTSEQSSAIPYTAQIHTKYENNIQSLINNLHSTTEKNDYNMDNFNKIINNTLSYNTKYQNKFDEDNVVKPTPEPEHDMSESLFILPNKYANLLNSVTSDIKQYGGGKKDKTKDKKHKMSKKYNKSSESPKQHKQSKQPTTDTSSTESNNKLPISDEDKQSENAGDSNMSTPKDSDEDTPKDSDEDTPKDSDEDTPKDSDEDTPDEDTPKKDTNTTDDEKESEGNNKYQSPSPASDSVHTSQINMLDSY